MKKINELTGNNHLSELEQLEILGGVEAHIAELEQLEVLGGVEVHILADSWTISDLSCKKPTHVDCKTICSPS